MITAIVSIDIVITINTVGAASAANAGAAACASSLPGIAVSFRSIAAAGAPSGLSFRVGAAAAAIAICVGNSTTAATTVGATSAFFSCSFGMLLKYYS